ncbi:hypothetical protein GCM10025864_17720 [Luteimicrobium album]|uniref:Uncharacterized protein n=1 Tax=Luteimicrobium album TaxID=1054550 RepID=A0ABQ6HZV5_9MICO|nr:hypothetical protein GCM10025864_17720 [Luteimicrobium album]
MVVVVAERGLDGADDADVVRADEQALVLGAGRDEEPDEPGAAGGERLGGAVRHVPAGGDDPADLVGGGRGDPSEVAVDDVGDGHDADAGLVGDVLEGDPGHRASCPRGRRRPTGRDHIVTVPPPSAS